MANIQDGKVYVYQAADLESATPTPVKVFDTPTDGVRFPHMIHVRPGSHEVWVTNRPPNLNGYLMRFNGDTRTVLTVPTATLETTSTVQDEPNEFAFSTDGQLAYVGHHGPTQVNVAIVNAATFTVKKLIPLIATAKAPGFVEVDLDGGRVYVVAKWGPTLAVVDMKTERVLRYIELGGFGVGYGVVATPDKKYLYIPLGVPEQSAVTVIDAKTLTVVTNIVHSDLNGPRAVRFTND